MCVWNRNRTEQEHSRTAEHDLMKKRTCWCSHLEEFFEISSHMTDENTLLDRLAKKDSLTVNKSLYLFFGEERLRG